MRHSTLTPVQVLGIGLDGLAGLTPVVQQLLKQATLVVGSDRHLSYLADHSAERLLLTDLHAALQVLRQRLDTPQPGDLIVVLTSGDPLFFGLGRLLLAELPAEKLTFHPHLSAVQLAFSRVKVPWQNARLISAHGRSPEELIQALQQGTEKIAVLTDNINTPGAIARLLRHLDLPTQYTCWVCENLGAANEQIQSFTADELATHELMERSFAPLNVVLLLRSDHSTPFALSQLPLLGVPDHYFLSFGDRPGLMTKREIRVLVLGELALQPHQVVWDIGAGTGSVSVEMARLSPSSHIYAIEKTAAGTSLIQQNSDRFQVKNLQAINGTAPDALVDLPAPDRIFIGGSGGNLNDILNTCFARLKSNGVVVMALATMEHLATAYAWLELHPQGIESHLLQVQLARSVPVGPLTRLAPLNPVMVMTLRRKQGCSNETADPAINCELIERSP